MGLTGRELRSVRSWGVEFRNLKLKGLKSQANGRECRAQGFGLRVGSRLSNFFTESAMTECDHMVVSQNRRTPI